MQTGFGAYWRLAWLPHLGCVGDQDAWLWEALQVVKGERTRELRVSTKSDELARWRDAKRRADG